MTENSNEAKPRKNPESSLDQFVDSFVSVAKLLGQVSKGMDIEESPDRTALSDIQYKDSEPDCGGIQTLLTNEV